MSRLCTAAQVNTRMNQTTTVDATLLEEIIDGVQQQILNFLGKKQLFWSEDIVDYPKPEGRVIQLNVYPVESIQNVLYSPTYVFDGTAEAYEQNTDYVLYPERGLLRALTFCWPTEPRAIMVHYTAGWVIPGGNVDTGQVATPQALIEACIRQSVYVYQSRRQAGLLQVNTVEGTMQKFAQTPLLADVEGLIWPYVDARRLVY